MYKWLLTHCGILLNGDVVIHGTSILPLPVENTVLGLEAQYCFPKPSNFLYKGASRSSHRKSQYLQVVEMLFD